MIQLSLSSVCKEVVGKQVAVTNLIVHAPLLRAGEEEIASPGVVVRTGHCTMMAQGHDRSFREANPSFRHPKHSGPLMGVEQEYVGQNLLMQLDIPPIKLPR